MNGDAALSWKNVKIGLVFTATLAAALLVVINTECLDRFLIGKAPLYFRVSDVGGLRKGAPVWLQGIEIGTVNNITLQPEGVTVRLILQRSALRLLRGDAQASIVPLGLLGNKYIELDRGSPGLPAIKPGDTIGGSTSSGFEQVIKASAGSAQEVEHFINHLDSLIVRVQSGKGFMGALFHDSILYKNIRTFSQVLADAATRYEQKNGTIKRLMEDDTLYRQLRALTSDIDTIACKAGKGEGTVGLLLNDPRMYTNLNNAAMRFEQLTDTLIAAVNSISSHTNGVLTPALAETLVRLRELVEDIKKNPHRYFRVKFF
jgi:phospholipid/cholesterol/gamma-HCH transport system substrate-binding protein